MPDPDAGRKRLKVAVVGPCASGKTTLVRNLRKVGIDAYVSGQEHSEIRNLWQRQHPDAVIGLNLDLETLRERRGSSWSQSLFDTQQRRLADAFAAAALIVNTTELDEDAAIERVVECLRDQESVD